MRKILLLLCLVVGWPVFKKSMHHCMLCVLCMHHTTCSEEDALFQVVRSQTIRVVCAHNSELQCTCTAEVQCSDLHNRSCCDMRLDIVIIIIHQLSGTASLLCVCTCVCVCSLCTSPAAKEIFCLVLCMMTSLAVQNWLLVLMVIKCQN